MSRTTAFDPIYKLVIFDCDGVLVDSEMLSAGVLFGLLGEIGIPIDFTIFREDFLGRGFASATEKLRQRTGKTVPENFQQEYFTRLLDQFARHLQPMPGVEDVLQAMTVQYCLASSSNPQRLKSSLVKCNMETLFDKRTFAAAMVKNAKPAPDLFLYAAEHMKVAPARCLVIEDSEMGVRAAQAAGMAVWHFAGGAHVKAGYRLPENLVPDRVVVDMAEMHQAFSELGICRTV